MNFIIMFKNTKKYQVIAIVTISIAFSLLSHYKSLNYYFFQDDFYELLISKASNLEEFANLFQFQENRSSYRPIGLQSYFFAFHSLFGLEPIYYRLGTLALFVTTFFLIALCTQKMLKDQIAGYLTAAFWVTSSIHFLSIAWIAAAWLIIGSFFFFASTWSFLLFLEKKKNTFYFLTIIFFLLSLGSFEFFIAWPFIMLSWMLLFKRLKFITVSTYITPFIIISTLYIIGRITFASLPGIQEYKIELNLQTMKHFFWYVLWSFNIPEEFKKQIIDNVLIFNPTFFKEFKMLIFQSFLSMFAIIALGGLTPLVKNKNNLKQTPRVIILSILWFCASIVPVLIFPNHSFVMYLAIPSIGIYLFLSYLISSKKSILLTFVTLSVWLYSSFVTTNFYRQAFWVVESQDFARQFSVGIKERYPTLSSDSVILYPLTDKRLQQAILNENAIKVIYYDESIRLYFDEQSLRDAIKNGSVSESKVLIYNSN